jgi:broad specificity phosphatase PhoE
MPADRIHLVRHGEVFNPDRVLYGRLPNFGLSELGHRMAAAAAASFAGRPVTSLYASPLQRAQESAAPWASTFGLSIATEDRIIEPTNKFEGGTNAFNARLVLRPKYWAWIYNPLRPSWGEPFADIAARVRAAMDDAWQASDGGDVVMVSHQSPIWMATRSIAGQRLPHDPRKRRCTLSSITSFEKHDGTWREVDYQEPAQDLLAASIDLGAV